MDSQLMLLAVGLTASVVGAGVVLLLGYRWGKFAALKALCENCPKWQAYMLAVLPAIGFAAALLVDGSLMGIACQSFCILATPAAIGACVRFNDGSSSAF